MVFISKPLLLNSCLNWYLVLLRSERIPPFPLIPDKKYEAKAKVTTLATDFSISDDTFFDEPPQIKQKRKLKYIHNFVVLSTPHLE